eukprot:gnl/Chilomastix_cuspidata/7592.p2 GENE.gnl/Chilomastix_cuspidata/7592~~gnl/Chilomastix_cuspidata/7592.p2  ORF type:complete len:124 (+),score=11.13 gnl/Chilomastix_cuspidata/7592:877-1248(+)
MTIVSNSGQSIWCARHSPALVGPRPYAFARKLSSLVFAALQKFTTEKLNCTVIDAPDHHNSINMITNTLHADVAALVVVSSTGKFEMDISAQIQIIERMILAKTFKATFEKRGNFTPAIAVTG